MSADVFYPDTIGGAGRVAYHLSLEFAGKGHEVRVMSRNADGNLPSDQKMEPNLFADRFFTPIREGLRFFVSEIKNTYRETVRARNRLRSRLCVPNPSRLSKKKAYIPGT